MRIKVPAEGEWHVGHVDAHILDAAILNFTSPFATHRKIVRLPHGLPKERPTKMRYQFAGMNEAEYQALLEGPFEGLLAYSS